MLQQLSAGVCACAHANACRHSCAGACARASTQVPRLNAYKGVAPLGQARHLAAAQGVLAIMHRIQIYRSVSLAQCAGGWGAPGHLGVNSLRRDAAVHH